MKIYVGTNFDIGCIYYVCVVCGVWCVVCGVWCVVCGVWVWCVVGCVCFVCMYVCMQESRQACICLGR